MALKEDSIWQSPLVRELALILAIKLIVLFSIKTFWFEAPTVPENGTGRVENHFFESSPLEPQPTTEEIQSDR